MQLSAGTTVMITSATAGSVDLLLSFCPSNPVPGGVSRVAAFQTVTSDVFMNLTEEAALYWLVSAWKVGELAANQSGLIYTGNSDSFQLNAAQHIVVTHNGGGWTIPAYDPTEYTIYVGFGLKIRGWVYWGYSVSCVPLQQSLSIGAGSYELVRSDGHEKIADPVVIEGMSHWAMPMNHGYILTFDACGNGVLSSA